MRCPRLHVSADGHVHAVRLDGIRSNALDTEISFVVATEEICKWDPTSVLRLEPVRAAHVSAHIHDIFGDRTKFNARNVTATENRHTAPLVSTRGRRISDLGLRTRRRRRRRGLGFWSWRPETRAERHAENDGHSCSFEGSGA